MICRALCVYRRVRWWWWCGAVCLCMVLVLLTGGRVSFRTSSVTFVEEEPDLHEEEDDPVSDPLAYTLCPNKPPLLVGPVPLNESLIHLDDLEHTYIPYQPGGHFRPSNCISRTKTAVIIPYRKRERHLAVLLNHLIPFLFRQQAEFAIFIVELAGSGTFNRALLLNVGYVEALKTNNFSCFVFHDVDLLPRSDYNLYRCGRHPRHMAAANSKYGYELLFPDYFGGVVGMSSDIYKRVNGHSNLYFGWGGEDDDLLYRLHSCGYQLKRYPADVGVYTALAHDQDADNPINHIRKRLLENTVSRMQRDGLSTLDYSIEDMHLHALYTRIRVKFDQSYYSDQLSRFVEAR